MTKLDDTARQIIKDMGLNPEEALWEMRRGNTSLWIMKHRYIERASAKNNITYKLDTVEANSMEGHVCIKCTATNGKQTIQTYGEVNPKNNKISYMYAMAEKRAIDRAVLKLLGLHGFVYSEDEIEKVDTPTQQARKILNNQL